MSAALANATSCKGELSWARRVVTVGLVEITRSPTCSMSVRVGSRSSASLDKGTCAARKLFRSTSAGSALTSGWSGYSLSSSAKSFCPAWATRNSTRSLATVEMLSRFDDAHSGDVHDCTHPALLLIRHEGGDRRRRLGCEMAIDIVMVDDAERGLSLRDGFHDLRAFLVDLAPALSFSPSRNSLVLVVSVLARMTDTPACRYSLPGVGNGDLSFHFGSARSSNDFSSSGLTSVLL